jgi:hypothetical protein
MACRTERFLTKLLSLVACMVLAVALVPAVAHADETEEPSLLEPQETVYTVIIDPGEGEGEPLVFRSDECEIAASASEAQYNQFYRESDGSLGFHIDAESCPETFTAPYGHVFYQFSPNAPHLPLSSETTTFTVLWVADAVETYRAIRGEFEYTGGIFDRDTPRVRLLKWVCSNRLETAERVLVYLYAELGSIRDLAQMLGVARSTLADEMKRIKNKIAAEMAALENVKQETDA